MTDKINESTGTHLFLARVGGMDECTEFIPFEPKTRFGGVERLELRNNALIVESAIERGYDFQELYGAVNETGVAHILETYSRELERRR
jgi:hypothetical protein